MRNFELIPLEERMYLLRTLPAHLAAAADHARLTRLLTTFEFLNEKIRTLKCQSLIADFAFSDVKDLLAISDVLTLTEHILNYDPTQLITQLSGRLSANCLTDQLLNQARPRFPHLRMRARTLLLPQAGLVKTLMGHHDIVVGVAVNPHRKNVISASWDRTLKIWDLTSGQEVATLNNIDSYCNSLAISPSAEYVVGAVDDGYLEIWNLLNGKLERRIAAHDRSVNDVTFSADGKFIISASGDHTLKLWHFETGTLLATLNGHTNGVTSVILTRSNLVISGSWDNTAIVWNLENGEAWRLAGHLSGVRDVALAPNERFFATGSNDRTVRIWECPSGAEICQLVSGQDYKVTSVAVMPDNSTVVSGSEDGKIRIWDVEKQELLSTLEGHASAIYALEVIDSERIITVSEDQTLRIWNVSDLTPISKPPHDIYVNVVGVTRFGQAISAASPLLGRDQERVVKVWDTINGKELRTLYPLPPFVSQVSFTDDNPDSLAAVISSEKYPQVRNLLTGDIITELAHEMNAFGSTAIYLQKTKRYLVLSNEGLLICQSGEPSSLVRIPFQSEGSRSIGHLAVDNNEEFAVSSFADSNYVTVWSIIDQQIVAEFEHEGVGDAIFLNGHTIVSASKEGLRFWDTFSRSRVSAIEIDNRSDEYKENIGAAVQLSSSKGGRYIFLILYDSTLRVIDAMQVKQIAAASFDYPLTCCHACDQLESVRILVSVGDASGRVHFLSFEGVDD